MFDFEFWYRSFLLVSNTWDSNFFWRCCCIKTSCFTFLTSLIIEEIILVAPPPFCVAYTVGSWSGCISFFSSLYFCISERSVGSIGLTTLPVELRKSLSFLTPCASSNIHLSVRILSWITYWLSASSFLSTNGKRLFSLASSFLSGLEGSSSSHVPRLILLGSNSPFFAS